ncbi:MAG TPA: M81 family metallopeptidase, partial [Alphaproteobacteria bacterium]|nr:M81 family metallopeptidase [Alphaproteobacteria bacterium]
KYVGEIVERLIAVKDEVDGLLLHLHGALATPSRRNADAQVLEAIREAVGPDFPIAVAFDLHGNIGPDVVDAATVLAGYHHSPHTDMAATGERAARMLIAKLRGDHDIAMGYGRPGIILPSIFSATMLQPLATLMQHARDLEQYTPGVLDITIFCGFAYADVPDCGMSMVVVTNGDADLAQRIADRLAWLAWDWRSVLFRRELVLDVPTGVSKALETAKGASKPVCLLEHADRLNDSTYTLRELLARQSGAKVFAPFMFDPESAQACVAAGAGAEVRLDLCGKTSPKAGGPLSVTAKVLWAGEKTITVTGPLYTGATFKLGPSALLDLGHGITVSLISVQWSAIDRDPFDQFGLKPEDFDIILLRSKTHFRHVYTPMCEDILIVDTPDWGPADVTMLPYEYADRASFPFVE